MVKKSDIYSTVEGFSWLGAEFIQRNEREGTVYGNSYWKVGKYGGGSLGTSLLIASDVFNKI